MNILISLVSTQTLPNVLYIKELKLKGINIEKYIFVSTKAMEKEQSKSQRIIETTDLQSNQYKILIVDEYSINDIYEKLDKEVSQNDFVYINITGGTKIMSMGVYTYFVSKFAGAKNITYLPFGYNTIKNIFPEKEEETLETKLNINEYSKSYGINILKEEKPMFEEEKSKKMLSLYLNNKISTNLTKYLLEYRNIGNNRKKKIPLNIKNISDENIKTNLIFIIKELGFNIYKDNTIDFNVVKYLTGVWLEEYVYFFIKNNLDLSEDKIIMSAKLERNNEIDIMFIYNNHLFIIECKTSLQGDNNKFLFNDAVYKLKAITHDMGLAAKESLVTLHQGEKLYDAQGNIKETYMKRLKLLKIKLFDRNILNDDDLFKNELYKWIGYTQI